MLFIGSSVKFPEFDFLMVLNHVAGAMSSALSRQHSDAPAPIKIGKINWSGLRRNDQGCEASVRACYCNSPPATASINQLVNGSELKRRGKCIQNWLNDDLMLSLLYFPQCKLCFFMIISSCFIFSCYSLAFRISFYRAFRSATSWAKEAFGSIRSWVKGGF